MSTSAVSAAGIKKDIYDFYENQSAEKTENLEEWLNSGTSRIPQSKSCYYFEDRKIENALKLSNPAPGARILEIGCNLVQMTFPLAEKKFNVVGFDLSITIRKEIDKRRCHCHQGIDMSLSLLCSNIFKTEVLLKCIKIGMSDTWNRYTGHSNHSVKI